MNFKEKVQSMTAKEIIMAMVNGLRKKHIEIGMHTFGQSIEGVCYGCAATNTICEISGKVFNSINIENYKYRAAFLETDPNFLDGFEEAIDCLRVGDIDSYNSVAAFYEFAIIVDNDEDLPSLSTNFTEQELQCYERLANYQPE